MKILIAYYTRTNTTKILAEELAKQLDASVEQIIDKKDWSGVVGYIKGGRAVLKKEETQIESLKNRLEDYDLILIGSPVWVGTMPPAIRTFIINNKTKINQTAFFATQKSEERQKIFTEMKDLLGKEPLAELFISTRNVRKNNMAELIDDFAKKII